MSVRELGARRWVVDVGQNINGWVRLRRLGPAGTEITLTYGEWLDHDGDVTQDHVAYPASTEVERTVTVPDRRGHLAPASTATSSSPATAPRASSTCGSRATSDDLTADDVTAVVVHTDLRPRSAASSAPTSASTRSTHRRLELPRQRLRHPDRLPHPGAGRVDRRLADLRRDRGVPLRRRRLLREVAARPRRRAAPRRQGHQPRPRVPSRRRPAARATGRSSRLRRVGRRRRPRALDRSTATTGDRQVLADQWRLVPRRGSTTPPAPPPPAGTSRGSSARPNRAPHERYLWDSGWHFGEWLEAGESLDDTIAAAMVADHGPVATAYLHRSAAAARRDRPDPRPATTTPTRYAELAAERRRRLAHRVPRRRRHHDARHPGHLRPRPSPSGSSPTTSEPRPRTGSSQLIRDAGNHLRPASSPRRSCSRSSPTPATSTSPTTSCSRTPNRRGSSWSTAAPPPSGRSGAASTPTAARTRRSTTTARAPSSRSCTSTSPASSSLEPGYRRFRVAPRPGGGITSAAAHHDCPHGRIEVRWQLDGERADRGHRSSEHQSRGRPARRHRRDAAAPARTGASGGS